MADRRSPNRLFKHKKTPLLSAERQGSKGGEVEIRDEIAKKMKTLLFRESKTPFGKKMKGTGEKVRVALFCGSQSKLFVQFGAVGQAAVDNRDDVRFGTYAQGFFGVSGIFLGAL